MAGQGEAVAVASTSPRCCGQCPAPTGSFSRCCSSVIAHSNIEVVAGCGWCLRALGFTCFSATNSAYESDDCCHEPQVVHFRARPVAFKSMLRRRGVRVVSTTEQADDTPTGKLLEAIIESVDEFYSENLVWGANARDGVEPVRIEDAFPAIISKSKFHRVNALMRSRAPKITHPRRVGISYLLSGLVKCKTCRRAFSGQEAQSGRYAYYVCQSIMKRGKDACNSPRLNARRFEEIVVDRIGSNILTPGNIPTTLVRVVEEQIDVVAREHRKRLDTIQKEPAGLKRQLCSVWYYIETADKVDTDYASDRMREIRDRHERVENAAADARATLTQRTAVLDDVETIAAYVQDMREFLKESELTERRAFIETFVKEIVVMPDNALMRYTVPMPEDRRLPGKNDEGMALNGSILGTIKNGGTAWTGGRPATTGPSNARPASPVPSSPAQGGSRPSAGGRSCSPRPWRSTPTCGADWPSPRSRTCILLGGPWPRRSLSTRRNPAKASCPTGPATSARGAAASDGRG